MLNDEIIKVKIVKLRQCAKGEEYNEIEINIYSGEEE